MAEHVGEEGDHDLRHTGHLDQEAEEDEERNGEQDRVAHAGLHAGDKDGGRDVGREGEIAERGEAEREGDRNAGEHRRRGDSDEEDDEVPVAERAQNGRQQDQGDDEQHRRGEAEQVAPGGTEWKFQQLRKQHQRNTGRQRGGGPGQRQVHGGHRDRGLICDEIETRLQCEDQEAEYGECRDRIQRGANPGRCSRDECGHAHVRIAAQRQHRAEHGQPGEQGCDHLVDPDLGMVQDVAEDHAQQHKGHCNKQQNGGGRTDNAIEDAARCGRKGHRQAFIASRAKAASSRLKRGASS